jgi:ABC-type transporter Mla MlaB component
MKQYQLPEKIIVTQITKILKQINQKIGKINDITFDLSGVKLIDSAGVAFLVYLKSKYQNVKFLHSTIQINNLCQLYKIRL